MMETIKAAQTAMKDARTAFSTDLAAKRAANPPKPKKAAKAKAAPKGKAGGA